MTSKKELIALQFPFFEDKYEENLQKLIDHIKKTPRGSVVVAPELCLTNFSFDKMEESAEFGKMALEKLLELSKDRVIAFTLTEKIEGKFYNSAKILYDGKVMHTQPKMKLFKFGDEDKYFHSGDEENIKIIEINGLKYAILICFEIRFVKFWERLQGADIILIPALWGKLRKEQFEAITKSMAIINQAFVIASDSSNEDMASSSGIITPFGEEFRDDNSEYITLTADLKDIKKMRRYMDIGIS
ncbi:MAG TPA: carbon-nitrogen hydrolase family protein [Campylobacterales bacterium]|nr:carbon-nitrogen hydrolase family protein [Campylobacterales bacterium]